MKTYINCIQLVLVSLLVLCSCKDPSSSVYPQSKVIKAVEFDWSTHYREAPGSDNWPVTWGHDGVQYTTWGDGGGFNGSNVEGRVSLGVAAIEGDRGTLRGRNIYGGVDAVAPSKIDGKSYGILDVAGTLYMWVSPGSSAAGYQFSNLYYSADQGRNWFETDCRFDSGDSLIFPTFIQGGQGYADRVDNYVYMYSIRLKNSKKLSVQKPGEILLMRVEIDKISERESYQFYLGEDKQKNALWGKDLINSAPVFVDSANGVGWTLSASYSKPLNKFLLITEHSETFNSNIGIYESDNPWGPWSTAYFGKLGDGFIEKSCFFYNISNKWSYGNGTQFRLLFTGIGTNDSFNVVDGEFVLK